MGTKSFDTMNIAKRVLMARNRSLARKLRMKMLPEDISSFYLNVVKETVEHREKNPSEVRNDFMSILVKMKSSHALTLNQVAAQSFVFFLAG